MHQFDDRPDDRYSASGTSRSRTVPAENLVSFLEANVDNEGLSDAAFRTMVRNTLAIVQGSGYVKPQAGARHSTSQFDGLGDVIR